MAVLRVAGRAFDVDVVVFDKDGTLIDFHRMWGRRAVAAVEAVLAEHDGGEALKGALYSALGYDPASGETDGGGPLAMVPLHKTNVAMTTVLYQHGLAWDSAERLIGRTFAPAMAAEPEPANVRPLGEVRSALAGLLAAGLRSVVATTDDRHLTLKMLEMLEISQFFELVYCGDDDANPRKPSPEVMLDIARRCAVPPERLMMISDTVSDMAMARSVGAAAIGVIGGATAPAQLSTYSDALISSIDELEAS